MPIMASYKGTLLRRDSAPTATLWIFETALFITSAASSDKEFCISYLFSVRRSPPCATFLLRTKVEVSFVAGVVGVAAHLARLTRSPAFFGRSEKPAALPRPAWAAPLASSPSLCLYWGFSAVGLQEE